MNIATEYRKLRADGRIASQALQGARYNIRMAAAEYPQYAGDDVTMPLPHGERIVMRLEHDSDSYADERLGCTTEPADPDAEVPLGWMDRDGRVLIDDDPNGYRICYAWWIADNAGWSLSDRIAQRRASGMARHDAWLSARESIRRELATYHDAQNDGYVGFVVTLYDANGDEVDEDSVWGFEASDDYAGQEAYSHAERMAAERARYWTERVAQARDEARDLRDTVRELIGHLRAERAGMLRDIGIAKLCELRARHSAAMRLIGGAA